ncbi:MAG: isoleucine--tRNA ligase [Puniceicoccales bacterium]|jgi:isoleucyl-tRNA synthetase|nr:isoleucine--tRNA ligase [Puniceicoccales bacterium]
MELKKTLNLPQTKFPLRGDLVLREPLRREWWKKIDLYGLIGRARAGRQRFFLHDGPPFTNGDVHIGTAFNKILKDIIMRHRTLLGYGTPYVPGWDCHGLPIEHKVSREMRDRGEVAVGRVQMRRACAEFSKNYSAKQREQFERLGLLGEWDRPYRTMDPHYEAAVLNFFARCVDGGYVYRSKKPIYWSIPCSTALAEAEMEYKDSEATAIWVKFPFDGPSLEKLSLPIGASMVIWTTTPWSLVANLALAVSESFDYDVLSTDSGHVIVASSRVEQFATECGLQPAAIGRVRGSELIGLSCRHPFIDRASPIYGAEFVAADVGSGCVHCAPGHGMDDYRLGLRHGLEVYCPIDDGGCYVDDGRVPSELVGLAVLDGNGRCPAGDGALSMLRRRGNLLGEKRIVHSYPHCWRSKTPLFCRAMDQWFLRLEDEPLRAKALDAIAKVRWIPSWGENRMRGFLENRPDWCISRQRSWGIPLPVFFDGAGRPLLDGNVIRAIGEKVRKCGSDCWFERDAKWLLDGVKLPPPWSAENLRVGNDTLDVWIDSGCSSCAIPESVAGLEFPADLYVEGTDQHRGWFQSSLWCGIIANGRAPYESVLTHGFIVGEDRKKISKSSDKPQSSDGYVMRYGADVVRLWVSSEDFRGDIAISDGIMEHICGAYGTIRNALRYLLGNLHDFRKESDGVRFDELLPVDRWALAKLGELIDEVSEAYGNYEFHRVYRVLLNFCVATLSAQYHDLLKDRLYTFGATSHGRRSAQTAMDEILMALLAMLTPILTFTADEAYAHRQCGEDFAEIPAHLLPWPDRERFRQCEETAEQFEKLFTLRSLVCGKLEEVRREKTIGKSLEASVLLKVGKNYPWRQAIELYGNHLAELFIVSAVTVVDVGGDSVEVAVGRAEGVRCERCWRYGEVGKMENFGMICGRCQKVLLEFFQERN